MKNSIKMQLYSNLQVPDIQNSEPWWFVAKSASGKTSQVLSVVFINGLLFVGTQAAEAAIGMGWSTAMDQESQQQQFGWDTLNKRQQCCSLVEVKDQERWSTEVLKSN